MHGRNLPSKQMSVDHYFVMQSLETWWLDLQYARHTVLNQDLLSQPQCFSLMQQGNP